MSKPVMLSNDLRKEIIDNAMKGAYEEDKKKCDEAARKLADQVYRSFVTAEQEDVMKSLPHGFFNTKEGVRVAFYIDLEDERQFRGCISHTLCFSDQKRIPANLSYGHVTVTNAELYKQAAQLQKMRIEIENKEDYLYEQLKRLLLSAKTVKKLIEIWPEGKGFIPEEALNPAPTSDLPAVIVANVTSLLMQAKSKDDAANGDYATAINNATAKAA